MAAPGIPSNFYASQGQGTVYVQADLTPTATSYIVYRSIDGVNFSSVATPTLPQFLDTTVTIGTQYWYTMAAVNISGIGSQTSAAYVVPANTGAMSLGQVRYLAQSESDMLNANFVSTQEWNNYISQSYFELYDLLVTAFEDYFLAPVYTLATSNLQQYPLPDGLTVVDAITGQIAPAYYKLLGVDLGLAGNSQAWVTLKKFQFISRNRYVYPQLTTTYLGVFNLRYRVMGNTIMFIPTPAAAQFIRLWYIPKLIQPVQNKDILDGVSGWLEYVIIDAAIKALEKEESDTSALMARKAAILKRIEDTAANRDAGESEQISDIRSWSERWGTYGPPNGDGGYGGF
jgi:hypothetical protein